MRLKNKVAVITGGAQGIGRAIAQGMAREGAKVVVADLQREKARSVADEVKTLGGEALAVGVDVAEESSVQHLAEVTSSVRDLFAQSGRYSLVDVDSADAAEVKARSLRKCDGCDAAIAQQLGAEQSFVGVVKRITRTEYTVRYQIRDASTGTVLSSADSGLRMGADYSWSRGAVRLIKDRLLEKQSQQ